MFSTNSQVDVTTLAQLFTWLGNSLYTHDLTIDSRKVTPNSIFCAYPGTNLDGRQFIDLAISQGAKFILWEAGINLALNIANYSLTNLPHHIGLIAAQKYHHPSHKLKVIGVTGTNGKTSITHWLNQAYGYLAYKTAIIGTTGAGIYPRIQDYAITTPDPITLQRLLANFVREKVQVTAMEVSSHALDQGRVNGVQFKTAIFTNLTQDHLDYHANMENYYQAKRKLFYWHDLKNNVINTDDKYGKRLYDEIAINKTNCKILSYGIDSGDLRASKIKISTSGMSFSLSYLGQQQEVQVKLIGKFNVYNLLAVAGVLLLDGYSLAKIAQIFANLTPVCGRMDTIKLSNQPLIVIDYAHTPNALENALITLKEVEHSGQLYCIFGCGGNRDKTKRPLMGKIAALLADVTVITSDNPRNEKPEAIIKEIILGITTSNYKVIKDRKKAIEEVIKCANANDIILIAGKGHEAYQEAEGIKRQFSDFEIAKNALKDKICI